MQVRHLAILLSLIAVPLEAKAQRQWTACDDFMCSFLALEMAVEETWRGTETDFRASSSFSRAKDHLELGKKTVREMLGLGLPASELAIAPCVLYSSGFDDSPEFVAGRAYEFEARRTLNLIGGASLDGNAAVSPADAYERLQCHQNLRGRK
jgi:hypothetical protein